MPVTEPDAMLPILVFPGGHGSARVHPLISADARPHFEGLASGRLLLQECTGCRQLRYPPGPVCTRCGGAEADWRELPGRGRVHSWVRYHRSFLTEFEALIPYVVLAVRLEEGPVVFGRLAQADVTPEFGMPVRSVVEKWADDFAGLAFVAQEDVP